MRTLGAIERRRVAAFAGRVVAPGTVSVHVRKGDKWVEVRALLDDIVLYFLGKKYISIPRAFKGRQPDCLLRETKTLRRRDSMKVFLLPALTLCVCRKRNCYL